MFKFKSFKFQSNSNLEEQINNLERSIFKRQEDSFNTLSLQLNALQDKLSCHDQLISDILDLPGSKTKDLTPKNLVIQKKQQSVDLQTLAEKKELTKEH